MADNGTSTSLVGENKQTSAQAGQGTPVQSAGTYGFVIYTTVAPNDQTLEKGSSTSAVSQTNITPANNTTSTVRYNLPVSAPLNTDSGSTGIIIGQKNITAASAIPVTVNHGRYNNPVEATVATDFQDGTTFPTGGSQRTVGGVIKYFQMTGFYVTGNVYESFVTVNSPAPSNTTNPNTGHVLIDTFVSSTWQA